MHLQRHVSPVYVTNNYCRPGIFPKPWAADLESTKPRLRARGLASLLLIIKFYGTH